MSVCSRTLFAMVLTALCACATTQPAIQRAPAAPPTAAPTLVKLSVIQTNDVHGRLQQLPLLGGYLHNLRLARERDHGALLLLDAGDVFQGTLESNRSEGASMVRGYDALGYTAVAVGNHEFDFGPVGPASLALSPNDDPLGALRARAEQAHFTWLSANLHDQHGGPFPVQQVQPAILLEVAGVRVGIVGGTTADTPKQTATPNLRDVSLAPLAESIALQVRALRARGAQVVIALVHAGGECRHFGDPDDLTECNPDSEIFELAKALPEHALDLIVGGHTHAPIAHRVHGIPIIESFANARAFGRVDLTVDVSSGRVVEAQIFAPHTLCLDELGTPICTHESYEGTPVTRDAKVSTAIAADLEAASAERSRPLGVSVVSEVTRSSTAESPLGNLLADLMLKAFPGADAAFNNSSSVRTALAPGPLTYGRIFEMFPFDNALATLRLPAATLALLISESLTGAHSFLSLAGLRANAHCEGERLVVELTQPNGQPLPAEKMLTIVTSDFLASHGEGLLNPLSLPEGNLQVHRDRLMRDALVTGLQSFPNQRLDGRDPALFDTEHPRVRYSGRRPLRCGAAPPAAPPAPLP